MVQTLRGHTNNVMDVGWSPDDSMLASASLDNLVLVWDSHGQKRATLTGARAASHLSPSPPEPAVAAPQATRAS